MAIPCQRIFQYSEEQGKAWKPASGHGRVVISGLDENDAAPVTEIQMLLGWTVTSARPIWWI